MKKYTIFCSKKRIVNTDPLRRCYNGCNFSETVIYSAPEQIDMEYTKEDIQQRLTFWIELNNYAVSQRGEGARNKYEIKEILG